MMKALLLKLNENRMLRHAVWMLPFGWLGCLLVGGGWIGFANGVIWALIYIVAQKEKGWADLAGGVVGGVVASGLTALWVW